MTLQVCLVGIDGIILASDQKTVVWEPYLHESLTSKILFDRGKSVAVSYAGHSISETVAKRILAKAEVLDGERPHEPIEAIAKEIYCEQKGDVELAIRKDSEVFLVSLKRLDRFYCLRMDDKFAALSPVLNKAVSGHARNLAGFFLERYYKKVEISNLVFLAAHTILQSARLNPTSIAGLEILIRKTSGFVPLDEEKIESLKQRSEKLDKQLEEMIMPPFETNG